jgi:hypothetical protein
MRFTTVLRAAATAGGISLLVGCATSPIGSGEASLGHPIPDEWQLQAPTLASLW